MAKLKESKDEKEIKEDGFKLEKASEKDVDVREAASYVKLNLSTEKEQEIAKVIMNIIDNADDDEERVEFIKNVDYAETRYEMEDQSQDWPWEYASQRRTGMTTMVVDALKPRMKKALFYSGPIVDVIPGKNSSEDIAEKQREWLDATMRQDMDIEDKTENIMHDAIMLNFGVAQVKWEHDTEIKTETTKYESADELLRNYPDAYEKYPQYVLKLTGYATIEDLEAIHTRAEDGVFDPPLPNAGSPVMLREKYEEFNDGACIDWINPKDAYFPKGTKEEEDAWAIPVRKPMRMDELKCKEDSGFFKDVSLLTKKYEDEGKDVHDPGYEFDIYECTLDYDYDDKGFEKRGIYWVAKLTDREHDEQAYVMLRAIKYPYSHGKHNVRVLRTTEHRHGFYKGGMARKLKSVNCSEDRRVNQIANAWDMSTIKTFIRVMVPNSPYNPRKHKFYPGATIPVAQQGEITEMQGRDIPASSMTLLNDNRFEGENLSRIPRSLMSGQVSPRDPDAPAKKTEMLLNEGNMGIADYLRYYLRGWVEIVYMIQSMYYQFTDRAEREYRTERGFQPISKDDIRAKAEFTFRSTIDSISTEEKARALVALLNTVGAYLESTGNTAGLEFLMRRLLKNWDEDTARNIDKIIPPGFAKNQQQRQMLAQIQQNEMQGQQLSQQQEMALMQGAMQQSQGQQVEAEMEGR